MISYEYPPLGGGIGVACRQVVGQLSRCEDLGVDLVTSGPGPALEREQLSQQVEIHKLPVTSKRCPQYWRASELLRWTRQALRYADRLARERRYDLCHCWGGWPSGLIGYRLRRRLPYLIALRGSDVPGYSKRLWLLDPLLFRPLSRRVWREAAQVLALSDDLRRLAWRTLPGKAIDILPNGVDAMRFAPAPTPAPFSLLFVGRLIRRKGVHHLIEAVAQLAKKNAGARLVIAGDGPEKMRLQALAERRGLEAGVEFLGQVPQGRLAEVYRGASILVLPSESEALGNVVLEAMASGLAVITTRTGAGELIDGNGQLIEARSPASIQAAVRRYLCDPKLLVEHQQTSRRLAQSMSWQAVALYLLTIYGDIARQAPGAERIGVPSRRLAFSATPHRAE
jgi:L-malate glycosyltransferase